MGLRAASMNGQRAMFTKSRIDMSAPEGCTVRE